MKDVFCFLHHIFNFEIFKINQTILKLYQKSFRCRHILFRLFPPIPHIIRNALRFPFRTRIASAAAVFPAYSLYLLFNLIPSIFTILCNLSELMVCEKIEAHLLDIFLPQFRQDMGNVIRKYTVRRQNQNIRRL